ncbi:MAG: YHS domain-containing (seleno)protein [Beijerinckiaceae bacterium]
MTYSSTRRKLYAFGAAVIIAFSPLTITPVFAFDPASPSEINTDTTGVAIRGFDPVAYFTDGKPTQGNSQFSAKFENGTYHFATAANRDAFVKEPAKYAPAYGGFCAFAASVSKKADGNPALWKIVDNKLYLNVNETAFNRWQQDIPGNLTKANTNWPNISKKAPKDL